MESEERAGKKRKLSHDGSIGGVQSDQIQQQQAKIPKTSLGEGVDQGLSKNEGGIPISETDSRPREDAENGTADDVVENQGATTGPAEGSSDSKQDEAHLASGHESEEAAVDQNQPDKPMSKKQQKRLRKQAEWEAKREERKVIRKQKQMEKRFRQREERRVAAQAAEAAAETQQPTTSNGDANGAGGAEQPSNVALTAQPQANFATSNINNNKPRPAYLPITILIDCDFDSLMKDNELVSLAAQITRCYSDNRKARFRAHLALCSFGGRLRKRFNEVLTHHKKWKGVKILEEEDFVAAAEKAREWMRDEKYGGTLVGAFERYGSSEQQEKLANNGASEAKTDDDDTTDGHAEHTAANESAEYRANGQDDQSSEPSKSKAESAQAATAHAQAEPGTGTTLLEQAGEIIYLTSEATETLTELKPYSTYIIGGLVDKNREKGLCYRRARERRVRTARLPIGEFMEMQSRKVLATNHVSEIMVRWLECRDWGQAFMEVIPKRKGGKLLKGSHSGGRDGDDDQGGNDDDEEDGEEEGGDENGRGEVEGMQQDFEEDGGVTVEEASIRTGEVPAADEGEKHSPSAVDISGEVATERAA